jgi:hypothetical protein
MGHHLLHASGVGGIGQTSGASNMRRGGSKFPTSRRKSRSKRLRSKGRTLQFHWRSSPSTSFSTSSSSSFDNHVFLTPSSRHHNGSPSLERRHERKQSYVDVMSDVKSLAY